MLCGTRPIQPILHRNSPIFLWAYPHGNGDYSHKILHSLQRLCPLISFVRLMERSEFFTSINGIFYQNNPYIQLGAVYELHMQYICRNYLQVHLPDQLCMETHFPHSFHNKQFFFFSTMCNSLQLLSYFFDLLLYLPAT